MLARTAPADPLQCVGEGRARDLERTTYRRLAGAPVERRHDLIDGFGVDRGWSPSPAPAPTPAAFTRSRIRDRSALPFRSSRDANEVRERAAEAVELPDHQRTVLDAPRSWIAIHVRRLPAGTRLLGHRKLARLRAGARGPVQLFEVHRA